MWLFRVAYHAFIDHKRKQKRSVIKDNDFFAQLKEEQSTEAQAVLNDQIRELKVWIDKLPEKQKNAVLLVDFHDLSYSDASAIMEVSVAHVKILLFRGRQFLRQQKVERVESDE
ncbi:RNA polymerase sigma factor (sigma-70 family) [Salirhabdus euzebyi]|uniref:RNA polymerase sigma factor (Sigma-70 family) n=2 Tax=Salirhabdus euzebyi TaxID=394506 RepID=A0A841Q1M4_9BACI|nr:RNA polymerase sigma factor (sigma-70 family) [Salirhabdus euzebyi]